MHVSYADVLFKAINRCDDNFSQGWVSPWKPAWRTSEVIQITWSVTKGFISLKKKKRRLKSFHNSCFDFFLKLKSQEFAAPVMKCSLKTVSDRLNDVTDRVGGRFLIKSAPSIRLKCSTGLKNTTSKCTNDPQLCIFFLSRPRCGRLLKSCHCIGSDKFKCRSRKTCFRRSRGRLPPENTGFKRAKLHTVKHSSGAASQSK